MNQIQLQLPFGENAITNPHTVTIEYSSSDFNGAVAAAHDTYGERVAVIALPAGCKLLRKQKGEKCPE